MVLFGLVLISVKKRSLAMRDLLLRVAALREGNFTLNYKSVE